MIGAMWAPFVPAFYTTNHPGEDEWRTAFICFFDQTVVAGFARLRLRGTLLAEDGVVVVAIGFGSGLVRQ
jgi:hypothetical protein